MAISEEQFAATRQELANNATEFSNQLLQLAVIIDADLSQAIRAGVLDVYKSITLRSPVKTGAYRASNSIANHEPAAGEDVVVGTKGVTISAPNKSSFKWKVGDGDIWLFNNLPYAERIENGWSKQAPAGVYRLALQQITYSIQQEIAKYGSLSSTGGGEE